MGKYENMMKCAQIRSLANEKQYKNAYDILQTLDIDKIIAITDLNTIADVYIKLQKYKEAKNVYLRLYDKIPIRRVLYQLVYLSARCGDIEEAEDFYTEYKELDKTTDKLILRYYIEKAKGVERKPLIAILQELKKEEYIEEWGYELAKLYHKEGMGEECVQECKDIILWFGEGLIVEKAMLLKHHYLDGADISSEKAILAETKNLAAELKIAVAIAEKNEWEKAQREKAAADMLEAKRHKETVAAKEEDGKLDEVRSAYVEGDIEPEINVEEFYYKEEQDLEGKSETLPLEESQKLEETDATPFYEEDWSLEISSKPFQEEEQGLEENYEPVYGGESKVEESHKEAAYEEPSYKENQEPKVAQAEPGNGDALEIEWEIGKIVKEMSKEKDPGHIAIAGEVTDKNMELSKYLAKELCKQQVVATSKIARIHADKLADANLMENRFELSGGCLFIEEANDLSLDAMQELFQFLNKVKERVVVIFSDTEEEINKLIKKNRKLRNMIEYHIQI